MEDQIEDKIKHERFERLKKLAESQIEENNAKYIGTLQEIIVDGKSKNNEEMLAGRTETNKVVIFKGDDNLINKKVEVKIKKDRMWYLEGEVQGKWQD